MLWPLDWPFSPPSPLCPEAAPSPSGKVITTHKNTHKTPFWFQSVSTSLPLLPPSIQEKEIIPLAEQLVSIAAFSKCTGRPVRVRQESVICPKRWKEGTRERRRALERPGQVLVLYPWCKAEYSFLLSQVWTVLLPQPSFYNGLFIHRRAHVVLTCLPKTDRALYVSDRCESVSIWFEKHNSIRAGVALVSLAVRTRL